ncbi:hypothetical protein [Actinokineospora bangkokensis]|uniref:Uncharacterized protein n=1 Tax=Actinokineospora bangkokensis TaxID=1193682 RepID=A0A1Q9LKM7_9PSEU|nr:hypothetical protein [Actinokineospora bangkokensis]OLR92607.1 hypothetical protein BJP25_21395 [Actinokineospora bangkokensis]
MALSRLAREFAAEIKHHDWSDAPFRFDRAGHDRATDTNRGNQVLTPDETRGVQTNVMWVVAQVLRHADPNLDVYEFAEACGIPTHTNSGARNRGIEYGLRWASHADGTVTRPGTHEPPFE